MNPTLNPALPPARRGRQIGIALLAILFLAFLLLAIGIVGFFRLSRDTRVLRNSLKACAVSQVGAWHEKLELRVGTVPFWALRTGLSFAPLEPEAHLALRSIRAAEVGIYELGDQAPYLSSGEMLRAADLAMAKRGWDRTVAVCQKGELVAVYMPIENREPEKLRACVAVFQGRQLILASARGDLEPLFELAQMHPEWQRF